ncbi:MAG: DUF6055 domain-containing protein [Tepidisphaeraceae bacterium]
MNTPPQCALVVSALLSVAALCAADSAPPASQPGAKELYLPAKIWNVPESNDFNNPESEFSFDRMVQSDNLALFWSKEYGRVPVEVADPKRRFDPQAALRECERFYHAYVDDLKFVEKGHSLTDRYKLLVFVIGGPGGTAFGGGEEDKVGILWTPASRINHPPYGALAHEMGHCFQYMVHADGAPGFKSGPRGVNHTIFEMTSQYMLWQVYPEWITFENYHLQGFREQTNLAFLHEANQYHSPFVLEYWSTRHGTDFIGKLWREARPGEDIVQAYQRLTRIDQKAFNDEMFDACRRFVTWDLPRVERVSKAYANQEITRFEQAEDGWFRIAPEKRPQNYGYNAIALKTPPANTKVTLHFKGMASAAADRGVKPELAGWRYGFLAVKEDGSRVYGDTQSDIDGETSFKVPTGTTRLWLVVIGAPTEHWPHIADGKEENDEQWPYQIKLIGTALDAAAFPARSQKWHIRRAYQGFVDQPFAPNYVLRKPFSMPRAFTPTPISRRSRAIRCAIERLDRRILASVTTVDPADGLRLTGSRVLGEWASDANLDGWAVNNAASSSVAGGRLAVTTNTNGSPLDVSLSSISSGPSLDYAYYNYVQVRMQLPTGFVGDVTFSFGTTTQAGFSIARQFVIPTAQLATDGQFHVYRIDVGLQVWWKGTLRDLRLSLPGTTSSQTASLDYVEVGDVPNDTYTVVTTGLNMAPGVTAASRLSIESKHFIFWYDPAVNPGGQTNWTTMAKNALHMAETSSKLYMDELGFKSIFNWGGGTKRKMNIVSWYSGYWSGGDHMNMDTSGLQDEGSGNALPHEIGHLFDSQNGAWLAGGHWESHANWYREQWVNHYAAYFAANSRSAITPNALIWSNLRLDNSRLIYHDYRLLTPLQFYASALGLDPNTAAKLWYQGSQNQTAFDKLATVLPSETSIKDVVASLMKYWPTLDFPSGPYIKAFQWPTTAAKAEWDYLTTSYLEPIADKPGWFKVPTERAPEKYAYMTHVLTPTAGSTSVTATVNGLPSADATADWRFTLQALGADGVTRYSTVFTNGQTGTLAILPTDTKVMLQVVATPGNATLDLDAKANTKRDTQDALRLTYPYEVSLSGATPATGGGVRINYTRGSGAFRTNPDGSAGGWVDSTASVASTAYVAAVRRCSGRRKYRAMPASSTSPQWPAMQRSPPARLSVAMRWLTGAPPSPATPACAITHM